MTPAERAAWRRAEALAAKYRPALQAAVLAAWAKVADGLPVGTIERLLRAGAIEAIASLVSEATGDLLGVRYTPLVRETFAGAGAAEIGRLPSPLAGARFDLLNPETVRAALRLESRALETLTAEAAATVRQAAARGIEAGVNPRTVARGIREAIGLAPNQEAAVAHFREALETIGTRKDALGYALRDRRFDATLRRLRAEGGTLSPERIDAMTAAYRRRAVAWNAETHARTAALQAQRAGAKSAWETALRTEGFDRTRVTKRWVATLDNRTRDEHIEANGTVVPFDEPYPYDGGVMTPGEGTYNCFPAGTLVEGRIVGGLQANYAGHLVELTTARGHRLTVTPNHPVLTTKGWIAAHAIREGDALFSQTRNVDGDEHVTLHRDVHDQQRPSRIEDVFDALAANGTTKATTGPLDLHGDAQRCDAEIRVVAADGYLLRESVVTREDGVDDSGFAAPDAPGATFATCGPREHHRLGVPLPATLGMSSAYLTGDGSGVALDPLPLQALCIGPASDWHTAPTKSSVQDDAAVAAFTLQLLEASAGEIAPDEVVEFRYVVPPSALHVYDLQSEYGWNLCNGIVCSNCRCVELIRVDVSRPMQAA